MCPSAIHFAMLSCVILTCLCGCVMCPSPISTVIMSNCHAALPCRLIPCFLLISCALQCRLLPCVCCSACIMCQVPHCHAASCHVSAAVHEPCVQCGTAMQAAAMCLLQPTGWCSLCSQAEDGAALPDNTRPHRASRDQRLCASCAAAAASTITKSVRRLQQRRQSCTAQPHGETIASSRH